MNKDALENAWYVIKYVTGSISENPPNLRMSSDEYKKCASCSHFNMPSELCNMYNTQVTPDEICDSWAEMSETSYSPHIEEEGGYAT